VVGTGCAKELAAKFNARKMAKINDERMIFKKYFSLMNFINIY